MTKLSKQIASAFGKKSSQPAAVSQLNDLSTRKDLLSKIAGCGPKPPGAPREGGGGNGGSHH